MAFSETFLRVAAQHCSQGPVSKRFRSDCALAVRLAAAGRPDVRWYRRAHAVCCCLRPLQRSRSRGGFSVFVIFLFLVVLPTRVKRLRKGNSVTHMKELLEMEMDLNSTKEPR